MVKQFKFLAIVLFSLVCLPAFSNGVLVNMHSINGQETPPCQYLTPTNFHAIVIGSDFVTLVWVQPGTPPPAYNMKAFEVATNMLVSDVTFPNTVASNTVSGLNGGTQYRFELRPVGTNGIPCDPPAVATHSTSILDLLVLGFEGNPSNDGPCKINSVNGSCPLAASGVTGFKFRKITNPTGDFKEFRIEKIPNNNDVEFKLTVSNNQGYRFVCQSGVPQCPDPSSHNSTVTIKDPNPPLYNVLAILKIGLLITGDAELVVSNLHSDYEIQKITPNFAPSQVPSDRADFGNIAPNHLSASPNPFTSLLDIQIPYATENNDVDINLYDLQGRLVKSVKTPGGLQIRSLATDDLLPGFYLLRVDTGDRSETIKVVKTQ